MTDILLIQPPVWGTNMPPMTIAMLKRWLEYKGFFVQVEDLNIELYHKSIELGLDPFWNNESAHEWMQPESFDIVCGRLGVDFENLANRMLEHCPKVIGFSLTTPTLFFAEHLIESIRKIAGANVFIIAGGKEARTQADSGKLGRWVDFFVEGEGEIALMRLLSGIKSGMDTMELSAVPGVYIPVLKDRFQPARQADLSLFPFPDYSGFDIKRYGGKTMGVIFSKGCIGNCAFCEDKPSQGPYRTRPPALVADELEHHVREFGIRDFWFHDIMINGDLEALEELCDRIIEKNLDISWIALAVARVDMEQGLFDKLAKAGCRTLNFGIESGSMGVLARMNKLGLFTPHEAVAVMKRARAAGIDVQPNFIVGFPGETLQEFKLTLDFISRNRDCISGITNINTCVIPPNSPQARLMADCGDENGVLNPTHWVQGNLDYNERLRRARKAVELSRSCGFDIYFSNLSEAGLNGDNSGDLKHPSPDIALINPPPWGVDSPPTALAVLSAELANEGFKVLIEDLNVRLFNAVVPEFRSLWHFENKNFWSDEQSFVRVLEFINPYIDEMVERVAASGVYVVGISVVDPKERISLEIVKRLKRLNPNLGVVIGGPACRSRVAVEMFKNADVDAFVEGAGEKALCEICRVLRQSGANRPDGTVLEKIPGVFVRGGQDTGSPLCGSLKRAVFSKSFPDYEGFDLDQYTNRCATVEWSRGCMGHCVFCKIKDIWLGCEWKAPAVIADELSYHVHVNGIREFVVADPAFNSDPVKLSEVLKLIKRQGLDISWSGQAVASPCFDARFCRRLKESGLARIELGLECGSNKVLAAMGKPYRIKDISESITNLSAAGIEVFLFVIVGFPGEGELEFEQTLEFLEEHAKYITAVKSVNTLHIIEGTVLDRHFEKFGISITDPESRHTGWESDGGMNTYDVRCQRAQRVNELVHKLGLELVESNVSEGKQKKAAALGKEEFVNLIGNIDGQNRHKPTPRVCVDDERQSGCLPALKALRLLSFLKPLYRCFTKRRGVFKVVCGKPSSETCVVPLGTWRHKTPDVSSCFGGKTNFDFCPGDSKKRYWRDFCHKAGVKFECMWSFKSRLNNWRLKISVFDNSYQSGNWAHPTHVYLSSEVCGWLLAGSFSIEGDGVFKTFCFDVPSRLLGAQSISVLLDDSANYVDYQVGKTVHSIVLTRD